MVAPSTLLLFLVLLLRVGAAPEGACDASKDVTALARHISGGETEAAEPEVSQTLLLYAGGSATAEARGHAEAEAERKAR